MRKLLLLGLIIFLGCNKDKDVETSHACSSISAGTDTLIVDKYKLYFTCTLSDNAGGGLEIIDNNENKINESAGFSFNLIQLRNGNECWESHDIKEMRGQENTFVASVFGYPSWAKSTNTVATIRFNIYDKEYYLFDPRVNSIE